MSLLQACNPCPVIKSNVIEGDNQLSNNFFNTINNFTSLKCVLFNACSFKNKLSALHHLLHTDSPDIVCITETWLHSGVSDSLLIDNLPYSVFRKDRDNSPHGGVCILTKNVTVNSSVVQIPSIYSHLELAVIDISTSAGSLRMFNCYRPPTNNDRDSVCTKYISDLCSCISSLYPSNSTVIIVGDFNFPRINRMVASVY